MEDEMDNVTLAELNFGRTRGVLGYGTVPPAKSKYDEPMQCLRFCTSCEKSGIVKPGQLTLMSHGCDSSVFTRMLPPMPQEAPAYENPVLFLLENPGGN